MCIEDLRLPSEIKAIVTSNLSKTIRGVNMEINWWSNLCFFRNLIEGYRSSNHYLIFSSKISGFESRENKKTLLCG